MSNQGFNAWAAQQPAPAGFNPGAAPAGPPMGPSATPPAQAGWGAPPAAPPPQGPPISPAPVQQQAPVGWGATPAQAPQAAPAAPTGGNVFGAGAFAGAAPVSDRKDCQDGDYVFQIIKTEQFRTRQNQPMFRILAKVAHVYSGNQPLGSEVTDTIFFGFPGSDGFKYGMADLLALAGFALGCASDHELKAKLHAAKPEAGSGEAAWSALADAMQDPNQVANPIFGPNPLAGMYYRALMSHTPHKTKPGQFNMNARRGLARAG